jgi:6-phosphofructokinase
MGRIAVLTSGGDASGMNVDAALNVALEAIDRLQVTASSHHWAFLIELMGREHRREGPRSSSSGLR